MDELFSPEIAELEQFIDSYVADDPVTTGGGNENVDSHHAESSDLVGFDATKEYEFSDDFQQELLEHQRNQTLNNTGHQVQGCAAWIDSHPGEFLEDSRSDVPHHLPHQSRLSDTVALAENPNIDPYSVGHHSYDSVANMLYGQYTLPWDQGEGCQMNNYHHVNNNSNGHRHQIGYNHKYQRKGARGKPVHTNGANVKHTKATYPNRPKIKPVRDQVRNKQTRNRVAMEDSPNPATKSDGRQSCNNTGSPRSEESLSSRKSSQSSFSDGGTGHRPKVVCGKSKAAVRSWLQKEKEEPAKAAVIEGMGELEISKDLPKFIELAQCYITNDQKLKEVAEMLCSKAMRNPRFGEKSALLCKEMSNHKLLGTKFRSAVLTVIQGQFKNRQKLLDKTVQNPRDQVWIGFVTYLVELYENVRTTSNERLNILINPVYECFFLMLKQKKITSDLGQCLYVNLLKVGRVLEKASGERMSELVAEIRDKCVMASPTPAIARRNLLRIVESYARGWSLPLDNESLDHLNLKHNDGD